MHLMFSDKLDRSRILIKSSLVRDCFGSFGGSWVPSLALLFMERRRVFHREDFDWPKWAVACRYCDCRANFYIDCNTNQMLALMGV